MNKTNSLAKEQIRVLSAKINELIILLQTDRQNESNRRELLKLVGRRRRLLTYLKKKSRKDYLIIIEELDLRG